MYNSGEGTLKNFKKAFYWYEKSAKQGNATAQVNLGIMYHQGEGTLQNKKKSAYWVRKSYENGFEKAKEFWEKTELWKYE